MNAQFKVLKEVEDAIATGSVDQRSMLLRHVTDLFVVGSDQHSDEEIALFDDVFHRLAAEIETSARALLAIRLAPIPHAPPKIISTLAFDDAIEVAGPVLGQSQRLDEPTLVENAKKKGQEHLLAISRRQSLSEPVTDVLVERGDQQVVLSTAENRGARFSETGFKTLVRRSDGDDRLAACVGARPDISPQLLLKLLQKASQHVRAKLEAENPHARRHIHLVVDEVTDRIAAASLDRLADNEAPASIEALHRSGQLSHDKIRALAEDGRCEDVTAALALMCQLPLHFVEHALAQERSETILVLARASELPWSTTKAILQLRAGKRQISESSIAQSLASFERLNSATVQEIVRFYRTRKTLGKRSPS
jgi:uncharacterized protein (DUF2336 family)